MRRSLICAGLLYVGQRVKQAHQLSLVLDHQVERCVVWSYKGDTLPDEEQMLYSREAHRTFSGFYLTFKLVML